MCSSRLRKPAKSAEMTAEFLSISQASTRSASVSNISISCKAIWRKLSSWSMESKLLSSHLKCFPVSHIRSQSLLIKRALFKNLWRPVEKWPNGGSFRENRQFKLDQSKPTVSFCRTFEDLFNLGSGVIEEVLESSKCGTRWDVLRCETPETSRILKLLASGHHPLSFLVIGTWKGGGSCAPNRGKMA